MKGFLIAWKDFKVRATDKRGFTMMLIMPIILTMILGAALKDIVGGDEGFPQTSVGLYVAKKNHMAELLKRDVLEKTKFITVKSVDSEEKLEKMVKAGDLEVGISIPAEWSTNLEEAVLFTNQDKQIKAAVVESIITSFTDRVQMVSTASQVVMGDLAAAQAVSTSEENRGEVSENVIRALTDSGEEDVEISHQSIGAKSVSSKQYYAAAMLAMFLLFNVTLGAKSMIQERHTETLARLNSTPTSIYSILFGKFLGTLYFAFIQFFLFYTATSVLFNVNWGENKGQVIATGFAYSVAVAGLSMLLAGFITQEKTADMISGIGIQILAIIGGSMLPIYAFPEGFNIISAFTPNNWALTTFLDIMSGVGWSELLLPFFVLGVIGFVSLLIGAWRLRGRYV
ncbi:ABC transporter permease [Peribacillus sp. NPDC096540]|uniref:ABC transporter permease n=1 Tax=Peribacillus sp. NPDC096540 TaxID=3390612 RepID=UPI003CFF1755